MTRIGAVRVVIGPVEAEVLVTKVIEWLSFATAVLSIGTFQANIRRSGRATNAVVITGSDWSRGSLHIRMVDDSCSGTDRDWDSWRGMFGTRRRVDWNAVVDWSRKDRTDEHNQVDDG